MDLVLCWTSDTLAHVQLFCVDPLFLRHDIAFRPVGRNFLYIALEFSENYIAWEEVNSLIPNHECFPDK